VLVLDKACIDKHHQKCVCCSSDKIPFTDAHDRRKEMLKCSGGATRACVVYRFSCSARIKFAVSIDPSFESPPAGIIYAVH
jgi:hypothetical protein